MYRYLQFEENLRSDDLGEYKSYGIKVLLGNREVTSVSDVSTDVLFVADLCSKCELYGLDPLHLRDFLEDSL